jgi:AcrR family transcriptional regulator
MPVRKSKAKGARRRELKREVLLEAALERIASEGLDSFTMEGVAEQAGVAKGTIYLYFDSKRALVEQAIAHSLEPLVLRVERIMESDAGPTEKLHRMAVANLEFFDDQRQLFRTHVQGPYFPQTQTGRLRERGYRTVLGHITRVVKEAIDAGHFRAVDPALAATLWLEALTAFILHRLRVDELPPIATQVETLLDVFLHGLSAS